MIDQIRGCGGTLRMVVRDLTPEELGPFATSGQSGHFVCEHPDGTVFEYVGIPTPGEQLVHEFPDLNGALQVSDWIDNDPQAELNLRSAAMILDQQATVNDLRVKEAALAASVLAMRHEADQHDPARVRTVTVPLTTAALALATLLKVCDATKPGDVGTWIQDRVAAADLADLLDARNRETTLVHLDSRSAERARSALAYALAVGFADDAEVTELAMRDLATALDEVSE